MLGQTISHYRVIRMLGSGGMGVVYEAEDTVLDRRIALKALPPELAADEARRQRFAREARAVAALNHPNIVTVFSVEEAGGQHFITMELVEGRTLSAAIPRKGLPLAETLKLASQVADALAAAHERGIYHRDIKPANIMVTPDGRVKILDFGLAKLKEDDRNERRTTETPFATGENRIVGTVAYMSPEQAQGLAVDHRTDIFSLGIVLFEMATGARPFVGDSNVAVLASIVKDSPKLASDVNSDVPIELARIIRRCLQKDREQRYQSAKDLRNELIEVREESASGELTNARAGVRATPRRRRWVLLGAGLVVLTLAAGYQLARTGWWPASSHAGGTAARAAGMASGEIGIPTQVTQGPGWETQPALSPDGSLVAYASNQSGNSDIWLADFRGGSAVQLAADPATDEEPSWFPDGTAVAFASNRGGSWNVWKVPVLGGTAARLVENASDPAISPDGRQIAFVRIDQSGQQRVMVAPLANPGAARLASAGSSRPLQPEWNPAWSRDGEWLCYSSDYGLWIVKASGGSARQLTTDREFDIEPVWADDGQTVYFSSYRGGVFALWQVSVAGGAPQRLTRGPGPERHPSVSQKGNRLAFSTFTENFDLVVRDAVTGHEEQVGTTRDEVSPSFSHDGRWMVYVCDSGPAGGTELWLQPMAAGRPAGAAHRLTEGPSAVSQPEFSPDDAWIAYQRNDSASRQIWVVPGRGGSPIRFTDDPADHLHPAWSPDGRTLAFVSSRDGQPRVWVAPFALGRPNGPARRVTSAPGGHSRPSWSPDGRRIAYVVQTTTSTDVWVANADGSGGERQVTSGADTGFVRWDARTGWLMVCGTFGEGALSLRRVNADTGAILPFAPPIRIGPSAGPPMFDVSADQRLIAYSRGNQTGDVFVSEMLRKQP